MSETEHEKSLREWAKGNYATEAATELLIRAFDGRFAAPDNPWVEPVLNNEGMAWIDFEAIPNHIGPLSSGQRGVLQIAASIGSLRAKVSIKDAVWSLDETNARLVVTAIARSVGPVAQGHLHRGPLMEWPA
jgi:hypothetical protein